MDREFYRQQAQRVRDLAEKADRFTKQRLLDLAGRYDARAVSPSTASKMIERPLPRTTLPDSAFLGAGEA
ncbi:hypothetical protein V1290_005458 [Bradyrhizobium sp. AZCC 1578]|uniref:hypothetical protein n=1 Tax=Bradyrhizobium sp. AZCC 1578 TaxID=3117027 RepID=UPI002FEE7B17